MTSELTPSATIARGALVESASLAMVERPPTIVLTQDESRGLRQGNMSQETMQWLNENVLIGLTDKRGTAWHYRADLQSSEGNHYPGFVPVADVERRLFGFDPISRKVGWLKPVTPQEQNVSMEVASRCVTVDGERYLFTVDDDHLALTDDRDFVLGIHGSEYATHNYREWLLRNVATILDDDLGISSAGLLRQRRQAWVEVSMPENVETPEGVTFRPNLLAFSSLDASFATTYKRTIGLVVCDNTLRARMGEDGDQVRFKHTSGSLGRVAEARQALGIIYKASEDFQAELTALCQVEVSDQQWQKVLDALAPYPRDDDGKVVDHGRSFTMASNKREKLDHLYRWDTRCNPWKGTKFGVIQTANTWKQHFATVRGAEGGRAERNMTNVLGGQAGAWDQFVSDTVDQVLTAA